MNFEKLTTPVKENVSQVLNSTISEKPEDPNSSDHKIKTRDHNSEVNKIQVKKRTAFEEQFYF